MRDFAEVEYDDAKEDQNVDVGKLLNYPSAADDMYPLRVEDSAAQIDAVADEAVRSVYVPAKLVLYYPYILP